MFYTYIARILAVIVSLYGLLSAAAGLAVSANLFGPSAEIMARYWPSLTTGGMIDHGAIALIGGVALGSIAMPSRAASSTSAG